MMDRHAFLIIAHNEPELLKILISLLDHPRCDIYIHIDRKADIKIFSDINTKNSKIRFVEDRIDVKWGHYSLIQSEMKLFETAYSQGSYSYYHLMSGVDLPLKPIEEILQWFDRNSGYEYIGIWPADRKFKKRMHHRYFFITKRRNLMTTVILAFQKLLGIKWNRGTEVWMGSNWGSFTSSFVGRILEHKVWIHRHFRYAFCGDELYKPTLMRHLNIENNDKGSLYNIDWKRGNPYTWQDTDYEALISSGKLFARKFSTSNMNIVRKIEDSCKSAGRSSEQGISLDQELE